MAKSGLLYGQQCRSLLELARDDAVRTYLCEWVDRELESGLRWQELVDQKPDGVGEYVFKRKVDLHALKGCRLEATLVLASRTKVQAVFFRYDSRHGLFVTAKDARGGTASIPIYSNGRVHVVCD